MFEVMLITCITIGGPEVCSQDVVMKEIDTKQACLLEAAKVGEYFDLTMRIQQLKYEHKFPYSIVAQCVSATY